MLDDAVVWSEFSVRILASAALLLASAACDRTDRGTGPSASVSRPAPSATPSAASSSAPAPSAASTPVEAPCPAGMTRLPGGHFWVGSEPSEHFSDDESPRFLTNLAPFCLDRTEVTAGDFADCVERGACQLTAKRTVLCNAGRKGRADHPINCVKYPEAEAYCRQRGARLPSEAEWEYAARGGERYLKYPWGEGSPDGRACWKHAGTCAVKSYPAGAFGLFDMSGNVWEWTESWYGAYPWPPQQGFSKVYRGGSFSRRFEKWMHTRLRDRGRPSAAGSHLGFRCALNPQGAICPFGRDDAGRCLHGVVTRRCDDGASWNGVRCAEPSAPRCRPGRAERPGLGCVFESETPPPEKQLSTELQAVARVRSPEFDADCRHYQAPRPLAYRYTGGSHDARTAVSRRDGCKNRDVGVGWNSSCCP